MIKRDTVGAFFLRLLLVALLVLGFLYILTSDPANSIVRPVSAVAFDHSVCQYPNRLSNPPDGCDNSDPANPECMKYGTETCDDLSAEKVMYQPVSVEKTSPTGSGEVVFSCPEGK